MSFSWSCVLSSRLCVQIFAAPSSVIHVRWASNKVNPKELEKATEFYPDIEPKSDLASALSRGEDGEGPWTFTSFDGEVYDKERIARDVSRMAPHLRDRMAHVNKPPKNYFKFQNSAQYMRQQYARFGRKSGIKPGVMWPSREEILRTIQREKDLGIPTLQESWTVVSERKKKTEEETRLYDEEVERNMANMPKEIRAFEEKQRKVQEALEAEKAKRAKLMEEARELLGFQVDPRDPRFQELLEQKEKEAKKLAKAQKKKEKEAKAIARLTSTEPT
ncbi:growth arrest and DNA damage-inducible proteins-interacting protein 1-like [Paramacrobiotus metropolitanus]|uniref:growth arrest and DNA damage-inducible proteins-interacting protein 1-like n=1 Tax=Paramacrobiotus metropolitanus TaxID=2943436 RepID=UPI002445DC4E|nr:growth arrest and DNA damage-inducible proteins-interacting protein 1-like [Paramacrobiotus metropolitanus]